MCRSAHPWNQNPLRRNGSTLPAISGAMATSPRACVAFLHGAAENNHLSMLEHALNTQVTLCKEDHEFMFIACLYLSPK